MRSLLLPLAFASLLLSASLQARAAEPAGPLGEFDPEQPCTGPVANPVCAYKTWFFCRIADQHDMCHFVLGKGPEKPWEDKPWLLPLSTLIAGPLSIPGYAFIGALKVDDARIGNAPPRLKRRLLGSVEVMDTYTDSNLPGVAIIGSEFYSEAKSGEWHLVGWSLTADDNDVPNECDDPKNRDDDICKLRVSGIPTWLQMLRGQNKGGK